MPLGLRPYVNQLVQVTYIMTQIIVDSQVLMELEQIDNGYEIDSEESTDVGTQYRLWKGWNLLGVFYQDSKGKWLTYPYNSDSRLEVDTHIQAIRTIIERSGILI